MFVATPVFDGATVEQVDEALVRWQEEYTDSPIQFDIDTNAAPGQPLLRQGDAVRRPLAASPTSRR